MEKNLLEYFTKNDWKIISANNSVSKRFVFDSFIAAFAWMSRIAMHAEKLDHHPEWRNIYNKVDVNLITHDKNTVTVKDLELAKIMDTFIEKN
tara:strand:+ start:415 stop:693 length:279 start_codon:yes stop_codon:yes gene_type:complete